MVQDVPATIWVSALDEQPMVDSRRLLVTHLTDLQNTEIQYAERARQTLLDWGKLPHLVRAGRAEVRLQLADPRGCACGRSRPAVRVWPKSLREMRDGASGLHGRRSRRRGPRRDPVL